MSSEFLAPTSEPFEIKETKEEEEERKVNEEKRKILNQLNKVNFTLESLKQTAENVYQFIDLDGNINGMGKDLAKSRMKKIMATAKLNLDKLDDIFLKAQSRFSEKEGIERCKKIQRNIIKKIVIFASLGLTPVIGSLLILLGYLINRYKKK